MKKAILILSMLLTGGLSLAQYQVVKETKNGDDPIILTNDGTSVDTKYVEFNGDLYFMASDIEHGRELWKFDGGDAHLVADINPGPASSTNIATQMIVFQGKLYFRASDGVKGYELWSYDGQVASMANDIWPGVNLESQGPTNFIIYDNKMYFVGNDGQTGTEWHVFDGQNFQVLDFFPGAGSSNPGYPVIYEDKLFFSGVTPQGGNELYSYDGNNLVLEANIAGIFSSSPRLMTVFKQKLYFSADDNVNGRELWRFDGQNAVLFANINAKSESSNPKNFHIYNDELYFTADDGIHGVEYFVTNGLGYHLLSDIQPGMNQFGPSGHAVNYDGKMFFGLSLNAGANHVTYSWDGQNLVAENNLAFKFPTTFIGKVIFNNGTIWALSVNNQRIGGEANLPIAEKHTLNCYPNPVNTVLTIDYVAQNESHVELQDLTGKILWSSTFSEQSGQEIYDVSGIPSGVYVVRLSDGSNVSMQRIVIE